MWLRTTSARRWWLPGGLALAVGLMALLAGCGSAGGGSATFAPAHSVSSTGGSGQSSALPQAPNKASGGGGTSGNSSLNLGPTTYLVKSLEADLAVPDPRKTAADLTAWITATDPRAQSAGVDYTRQDDGSYSVQITYSVEASLYPRVQAYLADYTSSHDGRLVHLHENVQDVTNQYVDLQSQLTNLRAEQQRLLDLMTRSSNLSDTIAIEDRLTQVEGEINQIEGRQNGLNGQIAYYSVTINLTPLAELIGQPLANPGWDPGTVLKQAWGASMVFGEFLISAGIWLGIFCIYAVPALALGWFVARLIRLRRTRKPAV